MKALAIAVHPDDETLGCGGTLLRLAAEGASLHWLLMSVVEPPEFSAAAAAAESAQVEAVRRAYPFATLDWLKLPATRFETAPLGGVVARIREVIARIRPDHVYIPNRSDVHSDHRVAFQAIHAVVKSFYMKSLGVRRVLACEVISETDAAPPLPECAFVPNVFVDISQMLERKLEIMQCYDTEVHPEPLPRSLSAIRALARVRGATMAVPYAEAFMLIRELV
jgi:LmbE family N-acetylglucosaminyl deacetylase